MQRRSAPITGTRARSAAAGPRRARPCQRGDAADGLVQTPRSPIERDDHPAKWRAASLGGAIEQHAAGEQVQRHAPLPEQSRRLEHLWSQQRLAAGEHHDSRAEGGQRGGQPLDFAERQIAGAAAPHQSHDMQRLLQRLVG